MAVAVATAAALSLDAGLALVLGVDRQHMRTSTGAAIAICG